MDRRGAVAADRQAVVLEQPRNRACVVVVELVEKQHVGPHPMDDLRDRGGMDVRGRRELGDELPFGVAGNTAVMAAPGVATRVLAPAAGRDVRREQPATLHEPRPSAGAYVIGVTDLSLLLPAYGTVAMLIARAPPDVSRCDPFDAA